MLAYLSREYETPELLEKSYPNVSKQTLKGIEYKAIMYRENPNAPVIEIPRDQVSGKIDYDKVIKIDDNLACFPTSEKLDVPLHTKPEVYGKQITLGDGQAYYVPRLRLFPYKNSDLPCQIFFTGKGEEMKVKKQFMKAYEWGDVVENMMVRKTISFSEINLPQLYTDVLSCSHCLTIWEVKAFGLISTDTLVPFLNQLLDIEKFKEFVEGSDTTKKN